MTFKAKKKKKKIMSQTYVVCLLILKVTIVYGYEGNNCRLKLKSVKKLQPIIKQKTASL